MASSVGGEPIRIGRGPAPRQGVLHDPPARKESVRLLRPACAAYIGQMPEHSLEIPVRYADTDAQGVVFFANYLTYMDEATTAWLDAAGVRYAALLAAGVDFVYADAHIAYRGSARHGDTVTVSSRVVAVGRTSFTSSCVIRVGERLVAEGELVHVCVDTAGRPVLVPDVLRDAAGL